MTTLRVLSLLIWGAVLATRAPAIWRVLSGRPRYYDVLWALLAAIAAMVLGYRLKALAAMNSAGADLGLQVYSILLGLAVLFVVRSYERARRD